MQLVNTPITVNQLDCLRTSQLYVSSSRLPLTHWRHVILLDLAPRSVTWSLQSYWLTIFQIQDKEIFSTQPSHNSNIDYLALYTLNTILNHIYITHTPVYIYIWITSPRYNIHTPTPDYKNHCLYRLLIYIIHTPTPDSKNLTTSTINLLLLLLTP